jgi:hypothetical protein
MPNPFEGVEWNLPASELRRFSRRSFLGCLAAGALASLLMVLGAPGSAMLSRLRYPMLVLGAISLAGIFLPAAALLVHRAICGLSACLGWLVSSLTLAALYFLFLSPYALCVRLWGRDPLRLKRPTGKSQWLPHESAAGVRQYYRQY